MYNEYSSLCFIKVLLDCAVQGSPPPQVLWTKDGSPVLQSNRIQQLTNGSLVIKNTIVSQIITCLISGRHIENEYIQISE